jgi:hypothetical protein
MAARGPGVATGGATLKSGVGDGAAERVGAIVSTEPLGLAGRRCLPSQTASFGSAVLAHPASARHAAAMMGMGWVGLILKVRMRV